MTLIHSNIKMALLCAFRHLNNIEIFFNVMVRIDKSKFYYIPDLSIVHGRIKALNEFSIDNPIAIFEVVSKRSMHIDRVLKYKDYWEIPSLKHYVLFDEKSWFFEHWKKQDSGRYIFRKYSETDHSFNILGIDLILKDIYGRVRKESKYTTI